MHHGRADLAVKAPQLGPHLDARPGVQVRERLVEQVGVGPSHERPREGDTLPLTAGELVRATVEQRLGAHKRRCLRDADAHLGLGLLAHDEAEGDVLPDRQVRKERVALEDHRDVARRGTDARDIAVSDPDHALVRRLEAGDAAKQRALAAAGRPDDDEELAFLRFQVDAVQRLRVPKSLANALEDDLAHRPSHPAPRSSCRKYRCATTNAATTGAVATTAPARSTG
jgi:hypothetical protein